MTHATPRHRGPCPNKRVLGLGLVLVLSHLLAAPLTAQEASRQAVGPSSTPGLSPALAPLLRADGALSPTWRFVGFPKSHTELPPTRFEPGTADGVRAVRVDTASSYGTLVHDWNASAPSALQWRWRLDLPLSGGKTAPDIRTKAGDDAALKVCLMFDHPLERVPFVERTVLRIARSVSGERLPAATLCYVWDSVHAAGLQGANPYTRRVRFIVLQGRSAPLQRWVSESRDVAQDFIELFADELPRGRQTPRHEVPPLTTVLIGADSDNTGTQSVGWVADLQAVARASTP
jgi:hypothetical protein